MAESRSVRLGSDDVTVAVVADTHGRPHAALEPELRARQPALILHAGDVGQGDVLDRLEAVAPVVAVRGNVDSRALGLPDTVDLSLERPAEPRLRLLLIHVGLGRLRLTRAARDRAQAADAQLVVFGHSHVPFVGQQGPFTLFNPGSAGPRRFRLPVTFGLLHLDAKGLRTTHVDLEHGGPWTPS